ncbi:MAG: heavy-metal-associated domain-containing protein [Vulcanimicrobiaceae bacterium]
MTQTITVSGMTCANCVRHVRTALAGLPGVRGVEVELASGRAVLEVERAIDIATLRATLAADDYGVQ